MSQTIIHLISSIGRGGRERQLANIASHSDSKRYNTSIIYFNDVKSSYMDEYSLRGISIKISERGFYPRLKELHALFKKLNPDIVYTWGISESVFVLLLSPFHSFAFVNGSIRHGILSKPSHYFRSIVLHLSPHIVANSKAGLKANKLKKGYILYNGIEERFLQQKTDREKRRKELTKVTADTPVMVSVANFVPYKDYYTILKALKSIKEDNIDFRYIICGDGPLRQQIEEKIIEFGLNEEIMIVGNVENVAEFLKISDLFVHSSKGEGCSNAILEAMAAGLPVIASQTGGTPEIVSDQNGWLFKYGDHIQLKKLIIKALSNPDILKAKSRHSRLLVEERFTIERMMNNYYDILDELIKR